MRKEEVDASFTVYRLNRVGEQNTPLKPAFFQEIPDLLIYIFRRKTGSQHIEIQEERMVTVIIEPFCAKPIGNTIFLQAFIKQFSGPVIAAHDPCVPLRRRVHHFIPANDGVPPMGGQKISAGVPMREVKVAAVLSTDG